jgi:hypothetical protein
MMATYNFPSVVFTSVISVNQTLLGLPTLNCCLIWLGAARHSGCISLYFLCFWAYQGLILSTAFRPTGKPSLCRLL